MHLTIDFMRDQWTNMSETNLVSKSNLHCFDFYIDTAPSLFCESLPWDACGVQQLIFYIYNTMRANDYPTESFSGIVIGMHGIVYIKYHDILCIASTLFKFLIALLLTFPCI